MLYERRTRRIAAVIGVNTFRNPHADNHADDPAARGTEEESPSWSSS